MPPPAPGGIHPLLPASTLLPAPSSHPLPYRLMSNSHALVEGPVANEIERDPVAAFFRRADALYRCAAECCRQHERLSALVGRDPLQAELRATRALVTACDEALEELAGCYERAASRAHPEKENGCWRAANALWLAAREYARRQRTSTRAARGIADTGEHSTRLTEIALDYDLEASALLLLKQATESYRKARPEAA